MRVAIGEFLLGKRRRDPNFCVFPHKLKACRDNADDDILLVIQEYGLAGDAAAAEAAQPERVADHGDFQRHRIVVLLEEQAARRKLDAQHREEAGRDRVDIDPFGVAHARQVHGLPGYGFDLLEGFVLGLPIGIVRGRRRASRKSVAGGVFPE